MLIPVISAQDASWIGDIGPFLFENNAGQTLYVASDIAMINEFFTPQLDKLTLDKMRHSSTRTQLASQCTSRPRLPPRHPISRFGDFH